MSDDSPADPSGEERADPDAPIRARLEQAADVMVQAPVRWRRVNMLARRKALLSATATLAVAVVVTCVFVVGGSAGRASLHPKEGSPFPLPFVGVAVPDLAGVEVHRADAKLAALGLKGVPLGSCPRTRLCLVRDTRPSAGQHVFSGAVVELYPLLHHRPVVKKEEEEKEAGRPTKSPGTKSVPTKTTKTPSTKGPTPEGHAVASIAVRLAPSQIVADGSSTTTVTATILGAHGRRVTGLHPTLRSSDDAEAFGSFAETAEAGVYAATLTSSPRAGAVTIDVVASGREGEAELTQVAGPPATISLALSPERIPADGRSTTILTARIADANGNPVSAQSVQFETGEEALTGSEGQAGVYTATLTSVKRPGSVRVLARDGKLMSRAGSLQETVVQPQSGGEGEGEGEGGGGGEG